MADPKEPARPASPAKPTSQPAGPNAAQIAANAAQAAQAAAKATPPPAPAITQAQVQAQLTAQKTGKAAPPTSLAAPQPQPPVSREDIWPRPPLDLTGFNDLQSAAWDFPPGLPGEMVDIGKKDQISLVPETDIPFGYAVVDGSMTGYCRVAGTAAAAEGNGDGGTASTRVVGIAHRDWTAGYSDCYTGDMKGYRANAWCCGVVRMGRVWGRPTNAVKRGDPVGYGADGSLQSGGTAIPGCTWVTDANACEMAVVQVNMYE